MEKEKVNRREQPKEGFLGFKENWKADMTSGFLVFLLALPLSLGIAGASEFPPIYGLVTAMIGGLVVSLLAGSALTINGPAAGLIVIVAGAVAEMGQGDVYMGWGMALGAIFVAALLQVVFGLVKLGKLTDFFPISAVHGMLAAIGIIIISKQLHILFGMNPTTPEGKAMVEPIELLMELKNTFVNAFAHKEVAIIGLVSLVIVFGWPMLPFKALKKIPSAIVVLAVSIPMVQIMGIHNVAADPAKGVKAFTPLLEFSQGFFDIMKVHINFDGMKETGVFIKYVVMFALVGSLEALLTVKAIDMMDPWKRRSNANKDLIAVGVGNMISSVFGGLPMISEVARSSANVSNGGKTRWANFYHGLFILVFLLFGDLFSGLIPKSALAAMLIGVGWKLAHPKEFGHMAKIGREQLIIFITTIVVTLTTDLLIGIAAGITFKLIAHLFFGVSMKVMFKAPIKKTQNRIEIAGAAVFSNFIGIKNAILEYPYKSRVILDVTACNYIDHTVIENLNLIKDDFKAEGGELEIIGFDEFKPATGSSHKYAALRK
jgi:MFS superfamily sulfate permease-like transporter